MSIGRVKVVYFRNLDVLFSLSKVNEIKRMSSLHLCLETSGSGVDCRFLQTYNFTFQVSPITCRYRHYTLLRIQCPYIYIYEGGVGITLSWVFFSLLKIPLQVLRKPQALDMTDVASNSMLKTES